MVVNGSHKAVLGGISLNSPEYKTGDSQPQLDAFSVFRHIPRIARGLQHLLIRLLMN